MSQQNGSASKSTMNANSGAHSQTLDHVTSYPLVSDLLTFYTDNSLGAKSIETFNSLYSTFVNPLLPYLKTPISIATPYLTKADELGDSSLSYVDKTFPAVKSTDFNGLKDTAFSVIFFPFKVANDSKDYVLSTYSDESKKVGGDGLVNMGKSFISTELRIASEAVGKAQELAGIVEKKTKAKADGKSQ